MHISIPAARRGACAAAVALALHAPGAHAQKQKPKRHIEEVVVTATKVEESLQDVPIAVTALTGDAIEELGIDNFADYVLAAPRRHRWWQRPRPEHRLHSRCCLNDTEPDRRRASPALRPTWLFISMISRCRNPAAISMFTLPT